MQRLALHAVTRDQLGTPLRAVRVGAAVAALALLAACSTNTVVPATQVLVRVRVSPSVAARAVRLAISVDGSADGFTFDRPYAGGERPLPMPGQPVTVALTPFEGDSTRLYRVTARAVMGGTGDIVARSVGTARVISGYVEGKTLEYELTIYDGCTGTCDDDETCPEAGGECVPARVLASTLPELRDAGPAVVDSGVDGGVGDGGGRDSGVDGGVGDGGVDGGMADLGIVGGDLGPPDLGPRVEPQPLALAPLNSFILVRSGKFASAGDNTRLQRGAPRTSSPMDWSFETYTGAAAFVALAATQFTGYGLTSTGELYAWGTNPFGLLGLGSPLPTNQPMPERSGTDLWRTIDAGTQHVCGIRQSGQLACWGDRTDGRIGVGLAMGTQTSPLSVDAATDWASVSAGDKHTCAIKTSGQLFCWGYNGGASAQSGQLGVGDFDLRAAPTRVGTDSDWRTVSAGAAHTCAIKTSGELYCWGEASSWGRLGLGMGPTGPGDDFDFRTPTQVTSPVLTWDAVVAGQFHSCAIGSDREIYCWGLAFRGSTGTGSGDTVYVPTLVARESGPWTDVATGYSHTCGRQMDGDYFCWGEAAGARTGTGIDPRPASTYILAPTPADIF